MLKIGVLCSSQLINLILIPVLILPTELMPFLGDTEEDEELRKVGMTLGDWGLTKGPCSNVRNLDGVVGMFSKTMSVDENGLPAKSFEVIVMMWLLPEAWDYHPGLNPTVTVRLLTRIWEPAVKQNEPVFTLE